MPSVRPRPGDLHVETADLLADIGGRRHDADGLDILLTSPDAAQQRPALEPLDLQARTPPRPGGPGIVVHHRRFLPWPLPDEREVDRRSPSSRRRGAPRRIVSTPNIGGWVPVTSGKSGAGGTSPRRGAPWE